jgi:hypothetical protein
LRNGSQAYFKGIKMAKANKSVKGQLSQDDIHMLCDWNSNMLSQMFDTEVSNICDLPVINGSIKVERPAQGDVITITEAERDMVVKAIAYSTLNQAAFEVKRKTGNLIRLYVMGFSDTQIENSGANYHAILNKITPNAYRIIN